MKNEIEKPCGSARLGNQDAQAVAESLAHALRYAGRGWQVVPLHTPVAGGGCSCSRGTNCPATGKHPRTRNGFKDASTDSGQLTAWWKKWPDANIGIRTGAVSGLVVLDVDPRNSGNETLALFMDRYGELPQTVTVRTGGGGWHFYFEHPGGKVPCRKLGDGLDWKADGGYVVAPPSLHATGKRYEWEVRP